jgi:hypothetical protein
MVRSNHGQASATLPQPIPGPIFSDALYRAEELKARMGWKDAAFRAACRKGLKIHRCGKRVYVTGADVLAFVRQQGGDA